MRYRRQPRPLPQGSARFLVCTHLSDRHVQGYGRTVRLHSLRQPDPLASRLVGSLECIGACNRGERVRRILQALDAIRGARGVHTCSTALYSCPQLGPRLLQSSGCQGTLGKGAIAPLSSRSEMGKGGGSLRWSKLNGVRIPSDETRSRAWDLLKYI